MKQETNPIEELSRLRSTQVALEEVMEEIQEKIETLEKEAWVYGIDKRHFGNIVASCNFSSWKETKETEYEKVFYIQDTSLGGHHFITASKQEAVELIEYMQEKIDYLETEEDEA